MTGVADRGEPVGTDDQRSAAAVVPDGQVRRAHPDHAGPDLDLGAGERSQALDPVAARHERQLGRAVVVPDAQTDRSGSFPQRRRQPVARDDHPQARPARPVGDEPGQGRRRQAGVRGLVRRVDHGRADRVRVHQGEQVHGRATRTRHPQPRGAVDLGEPGVRHERAGPGRRRPHHLPGTIGRPRGAQHQREAPPVCRRERGARVTGGRQVDGVDGTVEKGRRIKHVCRPRCAAGAGRPGAPHARRPPRAPPSAGRRARRRAPSRRRRRG